MTDHTLALVTPAMTGNGVPAIQVGLGQKDKEMRFGMQVYLQGGGVVVGRGT